MHTVVELDRFKRSAKAAGVTRDELNDIITFLALNPSAGAVIPGTGGARKLRFRVRGKGKCGGYRVISFFSGRDIPVFLADIFAKGDKLNLSRQDQNNLKFAFEILVEHYKGQQDD